MHTVVLRGGDITQLSESGAEKEACRKFIKVRN